MGPLPWRLPPSHSCWMTSHSVPVRPSSWTSGTSGRAWLVRFPSSGFNSPTCTAPGATPFTGEGSTSGLHHDTHDNIYVLLRGSKRFRLFAPSDALRLHTAGSITHVHPNGVINYGVPTRADGAAEASAVEWASDTAQATAAATAARAEELKAAGAPANEVREAEEAAAAADAAADAALDAVLALAGDASEGGSSDEEDGGLFGAEGGLAPEQGDSDDEGEAAAALQAMLGGSAPPAGQPGGATGGAMLADDFDDVMPEVQAAKHAAAAARATASAAGALPNNFSRVDLRRPLTELEVEFPGFSELSMAEVQVNPGEMLYLPAGWFHEVTSSGGEGGGHLAFNYWMHPPTSATWEAPYPDGYWAHRYAARLPAPAGEALAKRSRC